MENEVYEEKDDSRPFFQRQKGKSRYCFISNKFVFKFYYHASKKKQNMVVDSLKRKLKTTRGWSNLLFKYICLQDVR